MNSDVKKDKVDLTDYSSDENVTTQQNSDKKEFPINHTQKENSNSNLDFLSEVPISLSVVLGSTKMSLGKILRFHKGTVVELDQKIGEFVQIFVNNKLIAKGEIVVVEDKIAVNIVEIVKK